MGKGKREAISEKKLNIKKVIMVIIVFLLIAGCIVSVINKDKIASLFAKDEEPQNEEPIVAEEPQKTIEEILQEFGGEVIEQPKTDTYIVSKEDKMYTIYDDGEILEEKISFWNGKSSKPTEKENNIDILTPEEFKWVAEQVINGEQNFSGKTINLRKNIDFGARKKEDGNWEGPVWTSIIGFLDELKKDEKEEKDASKNEQDDEKGENLKRFAGTFNGNGFSIRGIYIDSDKNYQGLFGYSTGTVENVILKNSYISGALGTGAIVGLNEGTVKNCVTLNTIVKGKESKVGGIVGINMSEGIIMQSHTQKGSVQGKNYVAGIVGYVNNNSTISECSNSAEVIGEDYVGGIAGIAFFGTTIQTNNNENKIKGKNYVGGIVGYSEAQLDKTYNISDVEGEDYIGGLVGANITMGEVSKSYNTGKINGKNNVGGIAGTNNSTISNCYNKGALKATGYRVGGICGQNATESFIYNSYNIGKVEGTESIDGLVGGDFGKTTKSYYLDTLFEKVKTEQTKTEEELKNNILEDLGQEFVSDTKQINNGYPVLKWQI